MGPMHALTRMMASIGPTKNQITPFTLVDIQQLEFKVSIATIMTDAIESNSYNIIF